MNISYRDKYAATDEAIVIGLPSNLNEMKNRDEVDSLLNGMLADSIKEEVLSSEMGDITTTGVTIQRDYRKVIAVGLGDTNILEQTDLQHIFGKLFQFLKETDTQRVQVLFETFKYAPIRPAEAFGLMSVISVHEFESYKTDRKSLFTNEAAVTVTGAKDAEAEIERYQKLGRSIAMARDFSETPPNIMTPQHMADKIAAIFTDNEYVSGEVKDDETLEAEGYGLITAAGKASQAKPRLVTIKYAHPDAAHCKPIALVGKGITYDTGGYSIKTKTGMPGMKYDMSGAANVIGMLNAICEMELPVHVVAVVALAENMVDGNGMRPDDVYTSYSRQTVEVKNTDAEGRLVLGDAVFHASQYSPSLIMDFATLTGAVVAALGTERTGVFTNKSPDFLDDILRLSRETGETMWPLPITEIEEANVRSSEVADIVNHVEKPGRASFAAGFIKQFTNGTPWIHFDIAGTGTKTKQTPYGPQGATGVMIHTIVKYMEGDRVHE
ncbi:leucyl aminopeptidase family protein [Salinicoccus albus]|uniref:leucyl aminopeptidase family protein n=1 Tax=Salinicoccus albus TaxID=418756 RepID=UPI0003792645|nr:leucyl aminopeptidase family protein [Salinicoccus albus]